MLRCWECVRELDKFGGLGSTNIRTTKGKLKATDWVGRVDHVVGISHAVIFDIKVEPTIKSKTAVINKVEGLDLAESRSCGLGHLSDDFGVEAAAAAVLLHSDEVGDLRRETVNGIRDEDISGLECLARDVLHMVRSPDLLVQLLGCGQGVDKQEGCLRIGASCLEPEDAELLDVVLKKWL
jgi:hypothetical protein